MKLKNIISQPWVLIASFCLILISGEAWGGFYLMYILVGIPHGVIHSIIAAIGIIILIISNYTFSGTNSHRTKAVLNITGLSFLLIALFLFFYLDKSGYNSGTFSQTVPLITLILFFALAVNFLIVNLLGLNSPTAKPSP